MENTDQDSISNEIRRLREALQVEVEHGLEIQRQLDRTNADFEDFVSTSAHNARESLRGILAYSQLMLETKTERLDVEGVQFLGRIQAEALKMQSLLTGIVDYWALSTFDRSATTTDMDAVLMQALLFKDKLIIERGAIVTFDPLPPVLGEFEILTKVLRQLIRNGINYCAVPTPRIHISCRCVDAEWVFTVADNGPGVNPEFQQRIFAPFKRLHGKEYPGNGLGLAYCKRGIERLGGRIWVESAPGAGSTFCFSLPMAD